MAKVMAIPFSHFYAFYKSALKFLFVLKKTFKHLIMNRIENLKKIITVK